MKPDEWGPRRQQWGSDERPGGDALNWLRVLKRVLVAVCGWRYEGEFREGKRHGQGVMEWRDGTRYEGEWSEGRRHGQGVYTFPDGKRYEGEWRDSERHGLGACAVER